MRIRRELEYMFNKALDREPLSRQEAAWLIREVDPLSHEMYTLMGAANQPTRRVQATEERSTLK